MFGQWLFLPWTPQKNYKSLLAFCSSDHENKRSSNNCPYFQFGEGSKICPYSFLVSTFSNFFLNLQVVVTGAKSVSDSQRAAKKFARSLQVCSKSCFNIEIIEFPFSLLPSFTFFLSFLPFLPYSSSFSFPFFIWQSRRLDFQIQMSTNSKFKM